MTPGKCQSLDGFEDRDGAFSEVPLVSEQFEPGARATLLQSLSGSGLVHIMLVIPLFVYGELVVEKHDMERVRASTPMPLSTFEFPIKEAAAIEPAASPTEPEAQPVSQEAKPPVVTQKQTNKRKANKRKANKRKATAVVKPRPASQVEPVVAVAPPVESGSGSLALASSAQLDRAPTGPPSPPETPSRPATEPGTSTSAGEKDTFDRKGALRAYIRTLSSAVKKRYKYPRAARRAGLEGRVVVKLVLDGQGRVLQVDLASSSGHAILDNAALEAARSVKVLPAAPRALEWGKKAIKVPFTFRQTS